MLRKSNSLPLFSVFCDFDSDCRWDIDAFRAAEAMHSLQKRRRQLSFAPLVTGLTAHKFTFVAHLKEGIASLDMWRLFMSLARFETSDEE